MGTLRLAKASPKAMAYARHYLCDTCRALSNNKLSRPAKIPVAEYFGQIVGVDVTEVPLYHTHKRPGDSGTLKIRKIKLLNCICRASGLQDDSD